MDDLSSTTSSWDSPSPDTSNHTSQAETQVESCTTPQHHHTPGSPESPVQPSYHEEKPTPPIKDCDPSDDLALIHAQGPLNPLLLQEVQPDEPEVRQRRPLTSRREGKLHHQTPSKAEPSSSQEPQTPEVHLWVAGGILLTLLLAGLLLWLVFPQPVPQATTETTSPMDILYNHFGLLLEHPEQLLAKLAPLVVVVVVPLAILQFIRR